MKNLKSITLIVLTLFSIPSVFAGNESCVTQADGDWNNSTTWTSCDGTFPQTGDDVSITHAVSFNQNAQLGSFGISGAGDFDVAAGDFTLSTTDSNIDLSAVDVTLLGNLTLETEGRDIKLDVINGDFDLVLNGDDETYFEGSNSSTTNTSLKSITTDSAGTTIIKGIRNFTLTGDTGSIFKDRIELGTVGNIRGQLSIELTGLGGLTFDDTITSAGNREHSLALTSDTGEFTFSDFISVGDLTTNGTANTVMDGSEITTAAGEYNTGHMVFNAPVIISDDMVFEVSSFSGDITFANTINDDGDANTDSDVDVNTDNTTTFNGIIGGINPIASLKTDSDGTTSLYADITVNDGVFFNDATTSFNAVSVNANAIQILNDLAISNGDFTFNCGDVILNTVSGVISGSDNFIKDGAGDIEIGSVNTLTGNVVIKQGYLTNINASENIFPSVDTFSLASGVEVSLSSSVTDIFELTAGQSIIGSGSIANTVDRQQNVVVDISPGFSPGQLTFDSLYVDEFATLTFELNGTTAGTQYDQIITIEAIQLEYDLENGTTLDVSFGFSPSLGDVFTIIDNQSNNAVGDTFKDLDEGAEIAIGSITVEISYIGGTGNDVTLTVTQAPQTIYVDIDAANGGDGTTWATAFDSLHDGLSAATDGDQIWVADGIYYPAASGSDPLATFTLINGVKLYGGFNGTETDLSEQDPVANLTVISGDLDDDDTNKINGVTTEYTDLVGTNTFHLITSFDSDDTTLIDGFTLTAGWAKGMDTNDKRGSVVLCNNNSYLILNNLIVQGNRTEGRNILRSCESEITQSSFINNYTLGVGAISSASGTYTDVVFAGNVANGQGSLFYMGGGYLNLARVKIIGNGNGNSSVIRALNVTLDFNDVLMSGNEVAKGVLDAFGSTNGLLNNLTVVGNLNSNTGSTGVYAGIKSNISGVNPLEINNSIFWNNQDDSGLGTIDASVVNLGTGTVTITSSIIQASGGSSAWSPTTLVDGGNNLDSDPLFITDTDPDTAPTESGNAHLDIGSPAINVGDNSLVTSSTDLDGSTRIQDTTVDLGVYEFSSHTISVDVSGLDGSVVLQNNGGDNLTISTNVTHVFATEVAYTGDYLVAVLTQPTTPNQTCTLSNESGIITGDVTDISLSCVTNTYTIGGTLTDLANTSSVVIRYDDGIHTRDTVEDLTLSANGVYTFNTSITDGSFYEISIQTQPTSPNQTCSVTNPTGTINGANVTNIDVNCVTNTYTIGGTVSGLDKGNSVVLRNDDGINVRNTVEDLTLNADGDYTFNTAITDGDDYEITVLTQPMSPNQTCSISNPTGTINGAEVANIDISCVTNTYTIGGTLTGLANKSSIVIRNDDGLNTRDTVEDLTLSGNGDYTFNTSIKDGDYYEISIQTQPTLPNQTCSITNPTGTINGANVSNINIDCNTEPTTMTDSYTVDEDNTLTVTSVDDVLVNDNDVDSDELSIVNPGTYTTTGIGGSITIASDGTFTYTPLADTNGMANFAFDVTDGIHTVASSLSITVNVVNDAPTFDIIGDVSYNNLANNIVQIDNFADNFTFGPIDEGGQSVQQFNINIVSDSSGVLNTASMNTSGQLNLDFSLNIGTALIEISMQDNGGVDNNGVDTSSVQSFNVSHTDDIFSDGFEASPGMRVIDTIQSMAISGLDYFDQPFYDFDSDAVIFLGHYFELNGDYDSATILQAFKMWIDEVLIYSINP